MTDQIKERKAKKLLKRVASACYLHERDLEKYVEPRSPSGFGVRPLDQPDRNARISSGARPSIALLCKLGSIAVHVDEALSTEGHQLDWTVTRMLLADPEVKQWIADMGALLPRKRR
jgi:hypothetical protein